MSKTSSSKHREPTEAEIGQYLPRDGKAFRVDALSWVWWLSLGTLGRTLLATHHVIYPRTLGMGLLIAVAVLGTACLVTVRFWPWASREVQRFADVGALGFVLTLGALEFGAKVVLVPWTAALAGSVVAVLTQRLRRRRWRKRAVKRWARDMGYL